MTSGPGGRDRVRLDEATVRRLVVAGELLDGPAVCELLGCTPSTLRRLVGEGRLSGQVIGPGNRRYYSRAGLQDCLAAGRGPRRYEWRPAGGRVERDRGKVDEAGVRRLVAAGELLDGLAACEVLGCSPSTLRRLVAAGELHGQVVGPRTRCWYTRAGLEDYLARGGRRPRSHDLPAPRELDGSDHRVVDEVTVRRLVAAGELLDGLASRLQPDRAASGGGTAGAGMDPG
ncbi:MAG TPA: helix-turn-helix domain-containing protein [Sporichthyaceae bacterium]|nr:helix-turn-helix domain-containing protein [Sporichthyaceae bacterium]